MGFSSLRILPFVGLLCVGVWAEGVKRGRNEATLSMPASNVMGSGNITAYGGFEGGYNREALSLIPAVGARIGIGGIMQFDAQSAFSGFREIGPMAAHLQMTIPGNDRLRLFGAALIGDLYLSTAQDTISLTADETKPEYSPFLRATFVADIDWLALYKSFPLKTYLSVGLVDDAQMLYRYNQIAAKLGLEWKMAQHSFFLDGGAGLYRERPNKLNRSGDTGFEQYYAWIQPGARYRIFDRFSLLGGTRITVYRELRDDSGLNPDLVRLTLGIEAPLYFRETNTEAIRTLVFSEQAEEEEEKQLAQREKAQDREMSSEFQRTMEALGEDMDVLGYQGEDNEARRERREEIQEKMERIEEMLEELDE